MAQLGPGFDGALDGGEGTLAAPAPEVDDAPLPGDAPAKRHRRRHRRGARSRRRQTALDPGDTDGTSLGAWAASVAGRAQAMSSRPFHQAFARTRTIVRRRTPAPACSRRTRPASTRSSATGSWPIRWRRTGCRTRPTRRPRPCPHPCHAGAAPGGSRRVPTASAGLRQWYGTSCPSSVSLVRCTAPRGLTALQIATKSSAISEAPPIRPPSTSGCSSRFDSVGGLDRAAIEDPDARGDRPAGVISCRPGQALFQ